MDILILSVVFVLLLKQVDKPFVKKIKGSTSIEEAINYKKELLQKRQKFFRTFIIISVLIELIASIFVFPDILYFLTKGSFDHESLIGISIILGIISTVIFIVFSSLFLRHSNISSKYLDNLSIDHASDLLCSDENFVLYLREFERDIYDEKKVEKWDFSENILSQVVQKGMGIPLCAIGMNKEVTCPMGGKRFYVNDKNWKEEVLELMKKAEKIVLLVSDRSSCLWEIKNSADLYHKCVFVVDDLAKYDNAKNILNGTINLPDLPKSEVDDLPLDYDPRRFSFTSDNKMIDFEGELSDYCQMLGLGADAVTEADIKKDKRNSFYTQPWFIVLMIITILKAFYVAFKGEF